MGMRHGGDGVRVGIGVGCGYPAISRAWWVGEREGGGRKINTPNKRGRFLRYLRNYACKLRGPISYYVIFEALTMKHMFIITDNYMMGFPLLL